MAVLLNVTLDEAEGKADCATCGVGMTAPPSFGGIPRSTMLATFLTQHATHTKAGVASGLTAAGNPTRAARAAVATLFAPTPPTATSDPAGTSEQEKADG